MRLDHVWREKSNPVRAAKQRTDLMHERARDIYRNALEHGGLTSDEIIEAIVNEVCLRYEDILGQVQR